jgi:hypothetical protein
MEMFAQRNNSGEFTWIWSLTFQSSADDVRIISVTGDFRHNQANCSDNIKQVTLLFQLKLEFYWNSQISDLMKVPSDIFELLYADRQTQVEAKRRTFATFSYEHTWS